MSSRSHLSPAIALSISLLSCGGGSYNSCFAAGTLISTPAGPVAIEEIRVGQVVYAFDEARAARVTSTVREVFVHEDTAFDQLVLSDGSVLGVTGEHPVYLPDLGRYVEARTLRSGDALLLLDERGESGPGFRRETVARGLPAAAASRGTVYNFAVERNENYFANGVLVHNKSPSCTTGCIPSSTMTITVRIARSGDGGGSIKASGGGRSEVSCANDLCHLPVTFVEGKETYVFLRAIPDAQSHLAGWAGGCEGHPICALMVNKDQTDYAVSAQLSLCTRGKFCPRYQTGYSQLASFHGAAAVGNTLWVTASPVSDSNSSMKGSALWTLSGTELVPYEEPSAPRQDLFGIASSSQGEAWAVGVNGSAYSLSGSSWTLRQSTTVRRLSGVFASPQQTWVVGDAGTILRWQPSTWTPEPSLTTVNLHGVWAASASAAWAVGEQGTILRWDGTRWSISQTGAQTGLLAVAGISATDVWAVGTAGVILHWNGASWAAVPSQTTQDLLSVYTVSATNVWVAGRQGTLLHWDGTSFSAVAIETGEDLRAILTTPVGEVLALSGQAIFVSSP